MIDLLFRAYDQAMVISCNATDASEGKDPEWIKDGIMNDGFVIHSFKGMTDKEDVKR